MSTLETSIDIDAPAERVWGVLTDFPAYRTWNPFITAIEGLPKKRARLKVQLSVPGHPVMSFRPRVLRVKPNTELVWQGHAIVPGFFDGEHRFVIETLGPAACRLHHEETFRGVLVPLIGPALLEVTRQGFEAMNAALKARVEAPEAA